jgi:hypothetical protein
MAENIMIMKRIADDDTTGRNRRAGKDPAGREDGRKIRRTA